MAALASAGWVVQLLRVLPAPLHRALDAWSLRIARRRLEQRWPAVPQPPAGGIDYKVRPWRD
jgi:hypothetical protein